MSNQKSVNLVIGNMTCVNCQNKIEKELKHLRGVISASVSYDKGTAEVTYNSDILKLGQIKDSIEKIGYEVKSSDGKDIVAFIKSVGFISLIILLFIILNASGLSNKLAPTKLADSSMGIGMLFVIGLITSVHCVAMCGGINLSQSLRKDSLGPFLPTLSYNLGRVLSYTLCGFIFGGLGYLIGASEALGIPFAVQGILKLIAGVFMVIMGINMLDLFPWLRRLTIRVPRPIARVIAKQKGKTRIPFVVGILNGFMPCGPLQSMWIVALAAGNPFIGAASMFSFAIGTLPLMLGLGSIVSLLGVKFMNKIMKVGGVIVAVLGLAMLSQGLALNGIDFNVKTDGKQVQIAENTIEEDTEKKDLQLIDSTLELGVYPNITVEEGIPVKWTINVPEGTLTGCNSTMLIPEYGIEHTFDYGENVIEFTPSEAGNITYTCWMGMITGNISVVE